MGVIEGVERSRIETIIATVDKLQSEIKKLRAKKGILKPTPLPSQEISLMMVALKQLIYAENQEESFFGRLSELQRDFGFNVGRLHATVQGDEKLKKAVENLQRKSVDIFSRTNEWITKKRAETAKLNEIISDIEQALAKKDYVIAKVALDDLKRQAYAVRGVIAVIQDNINTLRKVEVTEEHIEERVLPEHAKRYW